MGEINNMIKIKGQEYPLSLVKIYIDDQALKIIDWLKVVYKKKSDKEIIEMSIASLYHTTIEHLERQKKLRDELKEED